MLKIDIAGVVWLDPMIGVLWTVVDMLSILNDAAGESGPKTMSLLTY